MKEKFSDRLRKEAANLKGKEAVKAVVLIERVQDAEKRLDLHLKKLKIKQKRNNKLLLDLGKSSNILDGNGRKTRAQAMKDKASYANDIAKIEKHGLNWRNK